jgi:hypothetical protein
MKTWGIGGMIKREHRNAPRKACGNLPTKTPSRNGLGFDPILRVKRLANNVIRHSRSLSFKAQWQLYVPLALAVINRILPLSAIMRFIWFSAKSTYISPEQHKPIFLYNQYEICSLLGKKWNFVYNSDIRQTSSTFIGSVLMMQVVKSFDIHVTVHRDIFA